MATPKHPLAFAIVLLCVLVFASACIALSLPLFTFQCNVVGNFDFYSYHLQPPVGPSVAYTDDYVQTRLPTIFDNRGVFRTNLILSSVAICFAFLSLISSIPLMWLGNDKAVRVLIPCLVITMILEIDAAAIITASVLFDWSKIGDEVCKSNGGSRFLGAAGKFQYVGGCAAFVALCGLSALFCCESYATIQAIRRGTTISTGGGIGLGKHTDLSQEARMQHDREERARIAKTV